MSNALARYTGNVLAKTTTGTVSAEQIDVYLKQADPDSKDSPPPQQAQHKGPSLPGLRYAPARSITWSRLGRWW